MSDKILKTLGWFYITVGLICNPWLLGRMLSPDGRTGETHSKVLILSFEILLIIIGLLNLKKDKTELAINLNLLLWTTVLLTPLFAEVLLRAGIAFNIKQFKSPYLYADFFSDNDYWKFQYDWGEKFAETSPERIHPRLGWSQTYITEENPLGLEEETRKRMGSSNSKILFYGDSFVKGSSDKEFQIPRYMNNHIKGTDVVDLGVAGYGTDQIYLLFKETYQTFTHPIILVGILADDDLDRTVLSVRTSQKPYFVLDPTGNLQLKGIPIEKNQKTYFRNYHLSIKSYFYALLKQKFFQGDHKADLKKRINAKLLELFKANAAQTKSRLVFVIFYGKPSLTKTIWQEDFLKGKLNRLGVPYIDTKAILLRYAKENQIELSSFYKVHDGHHNNLGNRVIAEDIIEYLKRIDDLTPPGISSQNIVRCGAWIGSKRWCRTRKLFMSFILEITRQAMSRQRRSELLSSASDIQPWGFSRRTVAGTRQILRTASAL